MTKPVISVEHLTKKYDLGVIGTGTLSRNLNRWWARLRGQPDPYTRFGQWDAFERIGESVVAVSVVGITRSMAYLLPAVFISVYVLKDLGKETTRPLLLSLAMVNLFMATYYAGGKSTIWWQYPLPLQIMRWMFF